MAMSSPRRQPGQPGRTHEHPAANKGIPSAVRANAVIKLAVTPVNGPIANRAWRRTYVPDGCWNPR